MQLRRLRYFVAVAEELHFSRAAERLGIRQPPLSQQIRALEDQIGAPLFDRSSRRVRLTAAGETLLPSARQILALARDAEDAARRAGRGDAGELAIGFVGSATLSLLPRALRRFRDRHPAVSLSLREMTTGEQTRALRSATIDIGLLRPPLTTTDADPVQVEPLASERLLAVLPAGHPAAEQQVVDAVRLAAEPFIMFPRRLGPGLHGQITTYFAQAGRTPTVVQEAVQMQTIVALVAGGLGVSVVPSSVARQRRADVVFRPLRPAAYGVHLAAATRTDRINPTVDRFLSVVRELDELH